MQSPFQLLLDLFDEPKPRAPAPAPRPAPQLSLVPAPPAEPLEQVCAPQAFRHPDANREVRLGEVLVAYEFRRGKRKRAKGENHCDTKNARAHAPKMSSCRTTASGRMKRS